MEIKTPRLLLRPYRREDVPALVKYANERAIWINLMDRFPHPYTEQDAIERVERSEVLDPQKDGIALAIDRGDELIGSVGWYPGNDVYACSAILGYWLALPFHGQGLMTEAVQAVLPQIFASDDFTRIQADLYAWNPASARVLVKNGFALEVIRKRAVRKDGQITDLHSYVLLREDFELF